MAPNSLNVGEQERCKDCDLLNHDSLWQPGRGFSSPAVAWLGSSFSTCYQGYPFTIWTTLSFHPLSYQGVSSGCRALSLFFHTCPISPG